MTATVKEARAALTRAFLDSSAESGCPAEADDDLNNASRRVVDAMYETHGEAWLGHVNLYGDARVKNGGGRDDQICWKWDGSLVCNFSCAFVAPRFDAELVRLIRERDLGPYAGVAADVPRVDAIHVRLAEIGGVTLVWS
jgi:hypothetical protein